VSIDGVKVKSVKPVDSEDTLHREGLGVALSGTPLPANQTRTEWHPLEGSTKYLE
jgi:hypothetical protein